jgi:hypothetical protein
MSLHILDIAENSVNAGATEIGITMAEDTAADRFEFRVTDNGRGMDLDLKEQNQFFTEKSGKRFGLGIPFLRQAARECEGDLELRPVPGGGTEAHAWFRGSHIDLKPLGDVGATVSVLVGGHPEIRYVVRYEKDGVRYELDTERLRRELEGVPLNAPQVLQYIREDVNEGIRRIRG